jgi:hypothetical protein
VLALAATAVACGDDGGGDDTSAGSSSSTTSTSETTIEATTTTEAVSTTTTAAPPADELVLSGEGLGPLRIGMARDEAEATGLVGALSPGCELRDPRPLTGPLVADFGGSVEIYEGVVTHVSISDDGSHTSPGEVSPGDTLDAATQAWEQAGLAVEVDKAAEDVFGVWFVQVTDGGTNVFGSTADPATGELGWITAPTISPCE